MDILNIKKKKKTSIRDWQCATVTVREAGIEPKEMNLCSFLHLFICLSFFFFQLSPLIEPGVISFLFKLKKNYWCSIIVVCVFSPPLYPTPAKPTSLPCFHSPISFCPCVLYSSSWKPFSPLSPPHSPLAIVRLLLTSMSLVIFCLLFFFGWLCSS